MTTPIISAEVAATLCAQADSTACMEILQARMREFSNLVNVGVHRETDAARQKAHVALDAYLDSVLAHGSAIFAAQAKLAADKAAAGNAQQG